MEDGLLLVVSGPSGAGKSTVCAQLRTEMPELGLSVSVTTRSPRAGEEEGINYFFRTAEQFAQMQANDEFLESAHVYGNSYGTPKQYVFDQIAQGKDILLEIEMQGALQVKRRFDRGVFIFVVPPTLSDLKHRILKRGSETPESLMRRFSSAYNELSYLDEYHYLVVNDSVDLAVERIRSIIVAEKCRMDRNARLRRRLLDEGADNGV
ncbi:MAG: guanylate kinase [Eubacteriales bacterium]|nr:guanylate kinase [Eubacteriales bacterium]